MTIGERIKILRKKLDYNQTELAEVINVSQSSIGKIERNYLNIGIESMQILNSRYNVNLNWLINGNGNMFLYQEKENKMEVSEPAPSYGSSKKYIEALEENIQLRKRIDHLNEIINEEKCRKH